MKATIFFSAFLASQVLASAILRRDSTNTCADLTAKSNNGDRKIAIVIDSSGSMVDSDPDNLRLSAGRSINDWLISKNEATGGKKPDLVTVIDFAFEATLDYPLGDPAGANASFSKIGADGGTFIAGGVQMAITQLTGSGTGSTDKRSGIVVFTDGEDSDTSTLVDAITAASNLGIRVSFGFLDASSSLQDPLVLGAVMRSGGQYSTITDSTSAQAFINLVLVNGLTTNDNPAGSQANLLGGLDVSRFISGSGTIDVTYNARTNETIDFTVQSLDAGIITAQATLNGKVMDKGTDSTSIDLLVAAPNGGKIDIQVKAVDAPTDSIIVIGASSNLPSQNCTVGIGGGGGNKVAKGVGLGLGLPAMFAAIGAGCFYLYKHFFHGKTPAPNHGEPKYIGPQDPNLPPVADKVLQAPQAVVTAMHAVPPVHQDFALPPMIPPVKAPPKKKPSNNNRDNDQDDESDSDCHTDASSSSQPQQDQDQHKIKRPKRFKLKPCECLKCEKCVDCSSDCGPECRAIGSVNCGEKCRVRCLHGGLDCGDENAHDKHRHRCHRCEKHDKKARREEAVKKGLVSVGKAGVKTVVHNALGAAGM